MKPLVEGWAMILNVLRDTDQKLTSYCWKAGLISFVPSVLVAAVLTPLRGGESIEFDASPLELVFGILILSPWLETLLMWPVLAVLRRLTGTVLAAAVASAVFWACLHSLASPLWGFSVVWPFFVFSICFLEWKRKSIGHAIAATGLTHMFQNAIPTVILIAAAS